MTKGKKEAYQEDTTYTEIHEETKKKKSGRKKAEKFSTEELQEKLNILFGGVAKIFGYEYPYRPEDFLQESKALVRLTEKLPVVGQVIMLFDPLLIVLGVASKWGSMRKRVEKEGEKHAQTGGAAVRTTYSTLRGDWEREDLSGQHTAGLL